MLDRAPIRKRVHSILARRQPWAVVEAHARLIRIPVDPPKGDAIQKFSALELPLVELTDAAGNSGIGFGYTIGQGGSTILKILQAELLPKVEGKDSRRIAFIHDYLKKSVHALGPGVVLSNALAAIDIALWDLNAKRHGVPLHILLGGAKEKVPVYNTDVGWLSRELDEMVELSRRAVKRDGFRALKLKVGKPDWHEDVARLGAVRKAVGKEIKLMIDANQSWTVDEAVRRLKPLAQFDLVWIEEPLLATDVQGYIHLGRHTGIPRAGGESLYDPADFYQNIAQNALDILQPDVARVGGITPAMEVCGMAHAANLKVSPHVSPELSLTVAAAVPNSMFIEYIPQMEPVLARRLQMVDGCAVPPDLPGHGIQFKEQVLELYEVTQ
ncbi:MAG TPA: mandelate racemase/muconate lactonizing enzyme family protein [Candidatus Angelobacter sp.]